jgi:hypothetical protein
MNVFQIATKKTVAPASEAFTNSCRETYANIQCLRRALFHRWLCADDIRFFKLHAVLFDLGGTAKSRNFLMPAFTAGQCIDLSRSAYPKFIV